MRLYLILRIDQIQIFQRTISRVHQIVLQIGNIFDVSTLMTEYRLQLMKLCALIRWRFLIFIVYLLRTIIGIGLLGKKCKFLWIIIVFLVLIVAVVHVQVQVDVVIGIVCQLLVIEFLLLVVFVGDDTFTWKRNGDVQYLWIYRYKDKLTGLHGHHNWLGITSSHPFLWRCCWNIGDRVRIQIG